ncbi:MULTISPECIES: alanine/glycine:cation symporter family protein [Kytococcus]|uniref:alanine/glycine:cation symporter family protein n=1 Tax=Kytococcus TaxID=57499 RepID=UPI0008A257F5|nr:MULTISPECIES: alanine/glycine:cation symporter family protein [Kytococcus]OFS13231.1 sodium:alanine symporter [Kytococcus sp. HMSC28H12]
MSETLTAIYDIVWSQWLVWLCLAAGLYFSARLLFPQVRLIGRMVHEILHGEESASGVSSFQALAISLSGRVGTGNIAGVATAIAMGGPGAVFWMWVVAFLGASTSFIESTLGQIYKERDDSGEYRGGPAYYIEKGLGQRWYGILFAIVSVLAMGLFMPGVQSNGIAEAMNSAWGVDPLWVAIIVVIALAFIVVGGIKRIATFASMVVPFMAVGYILLALIVLVVNFSEVPHVFQLIFSSAFGTDSALGGILGATIAWGVKRGIYSNEAGQGTGPHAAAAAEVSHPAKQGLAQSFAVYIDTLFVCSATAFMILSTGMYEVFDEKNDKALLLEGPAEVHGAEAGPTYTQAALDTVFHGLGGSFVAIALLFFAFTTIVAYYYMAETNVTYLFRRSNPLTRAVAVRLVQLAILLATAYGAVQSAADAWTLGDIGVGLMAWLNIIAILILQGPAVKALKDYQRQLKEGRDPQFDPREIGITNADFWVDRVEGRVRDGQGEAVVTGTDGAHSAGLR